MSTIPPKFACDNEGCARVPVTAGEAALRNWYIVTYSQDPKYVAINAWGNRFQIPERLQQWHACSWTCAKALLDAAGANV